MRFFPFSQWRQSPRRNQNIENKQSPSRNSQQSSAENFLLVTYDSCRYDSYLKAHTPIMDAQVEVRKAYSQATYTYASHASMLQGLLPHVFAEEPYYNRYIKQLWRLEHQRKVEAHVTFHDVKSIVDGFNQEGYFTCATGAMGWFRNNAHLREFWQAYKWTGIDARRQVDWLKQQLSGHAQQPFFALVNFGETHSPYQFIGQAGLSGNSPIREIYKEGNAGKGQRFDEDLWHMQVQCVEFLDARMGELLAFFAKNKRDVTVVLCGDHGECFGEEGLYGHGFYHPKVMEVPMGIFQFRSQEA